MSTFCTVKHSTPWIHSINNMKELESCMISHTYHLNFKHTCLEGNLLYYKSNPSIEEKTMNVKPCIQWCYEMHISVQHSPIVPGKYDHKMANLVCVRPFQQRHSFHIRSGEGEKKHPFEMKPVWSETRNRTSDGFTNLILTGGLTGATSYSSPSLLADQYQESGHYAPFESATCPIDMLLFFICWLYLIPSLLFPLAELGGSYSRPN